MLSECSSLTKYSKSITDHGTVELIVHKAYQKYTIFVPTCVSINTIIGTTLSVFDFLYYQIFPLFLQQVVCNVCGPCNFV